MSYKLRYHTIETIFNLDSYRTHKWEGEIIYCLSLYSDRSAPDLQTVLLGGLVVSNDSEWEGFLFLVLFKLLIKMALIVELLGYILVRLEYLRRIAGILYLSEGIKLPHGLVTFKQLKV